MLLLATELFEGTNKPTYQCAVWRMAQNLLFSTDKLVSLQYYTVYSIICYLVVSS